MTTARERLAAKSSDPQTTAANPAAPQVSPRVRTIVYLTMLAESAAGALVTGVVAVWWPELAPQVAATVAAILSASGIIAGGLGVVYRPTVGGNG